MPAKKRRLGRGLDALLGPEPKATAASKKAAASAPKTPEAAAATEGIQQLPVDRLKRGRYQPRASFPPEAISELAKSIKSQGIMQPIVARPAAGKKYEIIAGERRWRAAQQAGLQKVPVVVREVEDEDVLVLSLIENIQREDLNPLEEAKALHRLTEEFGLTHQQVSKAVGKS
ncbi:MAG: ParB/RepB/Spo0J family partition protein, partial [Pseudomonadales bacterium]